MWNIYGGKWCEILTRSNSEEYLHGQITCKNIYEILREKFYEKFLLGIKI